MKFILILGLVFVLYGCGSSSKKYPEDYYGDFDQITNEDFKEVVELEYKIYEDFFGEALSDLDSLSKESMARLPAQQLKEAEKLKDKTSQRLSLCYQGRYQEAYKLLDQAYFEYKGHPSYWNELGTCYLLQNQPRKALLFYNKAREINVDYVPAINNLGVIYQREGDDQKAMAAFEKASQVNQFAMTPMFNIAQLYLKYGFVDKAENIFKVLHNKHPTDKDVLNGLAMCELFRGKPKNAIVYYQKIDSREFRRPYIGLNYALALKLIGRERDARGVFSDISTREVGTLANYYNRLANYLGAK